MLERSTLSEQIAATVMADILDRNLLPGSLLPSEAALASQFGVSRPVVREAIRILTTQGIVRTEHGRGVTVLEPDNRPLLDLLTLCAWRRRIPAGQVWQARLALEVPLAEMAAKMRDQTDLIQIQSALKRMRRRFEEGNDDDVDANVEFHRALAVAAHNEFMAMLIEPVAQLFQAVVHAFVTRGMGQLSGSGPDRSKPWPEWSLRAHQQIYEAIATGDGAAARKQMKSHFDGSMQRWEALLTLPLDELLESWPPRLNLGRVGHDAGTPVERSSRKTRVPH